MGFSIVGWRARAIIFLMASAASTDAYAQDVDFIFEGADRPHLARRSEALELRAGPGRLRMPHLYRDFELAFEFTVADAGTQAGVTLSTWPAVGGAARRYELSFSRVMAGGAPDGPLIATSGPAALIQPGDVKPAAPGVWRQVTMRRDGRQLTMIIDAIPAGSYELDAEAATVFFTASAGAVRLRRVSMRALAEAARETPSLWELLPHGEKSQSVRGPDLIHEQRPQYTSEAMRARIEGVVEVEAIVLPDGSVGDVRVIRALDPDLGLDRNAVRAVYRWKFKPALRGGEPVPIVVSIQLTFCLRSC